MAMSRLQSQTCYVPQRDIGMALSLIARDNTWWMTDAGSFDLIWLESKLPGVIEKKVSRRDLEAD